MRIMIRTYEQIEHDIIKDLQATDTMYYKDADYSSWFNFFSDAEYGNDDINLYEKVLENEFTEKRMEDIWQQYH